MSEQAVLERLSGLVDELQDADVATGLGSGALEELKALRRQIDRLESVWSARVAAVHAAGAAIGGGYATTAAFLRHACHISPGAARARVDASMELRERPAVADAFAEGAISYPHVNAIRDALAPLPPELQVDAEPVLVSAARRFDPARVHQIGRRLRHIADPDGQAGADEARREQRWFEVPISFRGVGLPRGVLDAESAAVVRSAIDALSTKAGADDERTPAQRRADALVELCSRALDSGQLPEVGGERPHLNVMVDWVTLTGASREPAELAGVGPISTEMARRLACDALVTRISTLDSPDSPAGVLADGPTGNIPPCIPSGHGAPRCHAGGPLQAALPGLLEPVLVSQRAGEVPAGNSARGNELPVRGGASGNELPVRGRASGNEPPVRGGASGNEPPVRDGASELPVRDGAAAGRLPSPLPTDAALALPTWLGEPLPPGLLAALPPPLRGPTQILDVGRACRTATTPIRKALAARDKGCVFPGCDRPPSRCEAHHILHWIDGGVTALYNMVLLCWHHHHFLHEQKWSLRLHPDGHVAVAPPPSKTPSGM